MTRVALLTIGDGRDDLLRATIRSFKEATDRHVDSLRASVRVHVDDREHALGFCGAIREGWRRLRELPDWTHVFHLEEDWQFDRPVLLAELAFLLDAEHPDGRYAQVALRRGPEPRETPVLEAWPDEFHERCLLYAPTGTMPHFLNHRLFWTTNPSLYRRDIVEGFDWPEGPECERVFGQRMVDAGMRFAYWGGRADEPWITHTGRGARTGTGY